MNSKTENKKFIQGIHYYLEEGRVVFTALFLSERGYCCGSRCRNCPYNPSHIKGIQNLENNQHYDKTT